MDNRDHPHERRLRTIIPPPEPLPEHVLLVGIDDPLARMFWRAARDLTEWSASPPAPRIIDPTDAGVFREQLAYAASKTPELEEALGAFGLLRLNPKLAQLSALAKACQQVHVWADARGMQETALLFAESWARIDAENPIAANEAGRAARRTSHVLRAEVWFERAYTLAARYKNRREKIRALIGHGGYLRELGRYREAQSKFFDAARIAASTRRHRQAAEVQHELLTIAAETGSYAEAEHYMRAALREYPVHHRALPWLAHDWAFFLVRLSLCKEARVLLEAVRPHVARRDLQVVIEGTLGRAVAGCGDRNAYELCRERVLVLSSVHGEYAAAAFAHLAVGAQFFGEWELAEEMGVRAIEIARTRHQLDVESGATEIVVAIRARQPAPQQATVPQPNKLAAIERDMLSRLHASTKPRRRQVVVDPEAGGRPDRPTDEGQPTGPRTDPRREPPRRSQ
jgi:tetratricopeptide (TPR) repeat protein